MTALDLRVAQRPNSPMTTYRYDAYDAAFVRERVAEFREQVRRRLSGALTEEEFRPFRLMNGLISSFTPTCCASLFLMGR